MVKLPDGSIYPIGTDKDVIDVFVPEADTVSDYDVKVTGYKLGFNNGIRLRVFFTIPEEKINSGTEKITLTLESRSALNFTLTRETVKNEVISNQVYYYVEVPVPPAKFSRNIKFVAYNGSVQDSKEYNYSIKQYGNYILNNKELYGGNNSLELFYFIEALLNYGGKAQLRYSELTNNLASENIEIDDSYVTKDFLKEYKMFSSYNETDFFLWCLINLSR